MSRIDIEEAKDHFIEIIHHVVNGEEVIIEQHNQAVAKISPATEILVPRQPGSARGMVWMADDFDAPLEDFADYM